MRELIQGVGVEVKPDDGSSPEHDTADGEDATATPEVGDEFVLEVSEGVGDGVEHTGRYVRASGVLL